MTKTESPSTPPPASSEPPSIWRRRNVLIAIAIAIAVPLVGVALALAFDPTPKPATAFWSLLQAEVCMVFIVLGVGQSIPRVRARLELPDINGDEREQAIALRSNSFTVNVALTAVMFGVLWLSIAERLGVHVPASMTMDGVLMLCIGLHTVNVCAVVYYSRRM